MKFRGAKVDANQRRLVALMRKHGAVVFHVHQVKGLADVLVAYRGNLYLVEIKNGDRLPKKFWKMSRTERYNYLYEKRLSEKERAAVSGFIQQGVVIQIIYDEQSALELLGQWDRI